MDNKSVQPEPTYEWPNLRHWCISFLRIFLQCANALDTKGGWQAYNRALEALPRLKRRKVKTIGDHRVRFIVEVITDHIDEASDKKAALPGMFDDAIGAARAWLRVLEDTDDIDKVAKEVRKIDDMT